MINIVCGTVALYEKILVAYSSHQKTLAADGFFKGVVQRRKYSVGEVLGENLPEQHLDGVCIFSCGPVCVLKIGKLESIWQQGQMLGVIFSALCCSIIKITGIHKYINYRRTRRNDLVAGKCLAH